MFRYETVGDGRRPPWWRTTGYVLIVAALSLISVAFSPLGVEMTTPNTSGAFLIAAMGVLLLAVASPVVLFWRHRAPFIVALTTAVVPLLVPLGNALPLTALASLIGRRRGPAVIATTVFTAVASSTVVLLDLSHQPVAASFWKSILGPVGADPNEDLVVGWVEPVAIIVVQLALAIGSGLLVRARRVTQGAIRAVDAERAVSDRLGDEVARRQERERIAREVHDAMGHRLSLLNLHAGALEANSAEDPRLAQSAHLVRESAGAAMDDLRSLLDVLREPVGADAPAVPLSELATVVGESFGAGQPLNSSIFIADPDSADPALSRAVFRIVQEVLTNARKHAPSETVFLTVNGGRDQGIVIEARNRYLGGWGAGTSGATRGLGGIRERAELLGGSTSFGVDGPWFRVTVRLPWRSAA